ncbi:MAG TPA: hypothetical protein VOA41_22195 [Candidatus Dormibacteraeota bacterium]|nr:hypothetical protein [Candidatus Dormibacteraeota bacterium]
MDRVGLSTFAVTDLSISIGQLPLTLHFLEAGLRQRAGARYSRFHRGDSEERGFPVFLEPSTNAQQLGSRFSYTHDDAVLSLDNQAAHFRGVRHEHALDSLLRILLTQLLLPAHGFLLHAATMMRDRRGYVFVGPSGAGKSTVAALSPAGSVLTDEISLVRGDGQSWFAHGTPFWGEFRADGANQRVPLAGIFSLAQASVNRVERLSTKEALRALLPNVLFFSSASREHSELLTLLAGAAEQVPFYRLLFRKEPSFWEAIP